MDLQRFIFDLKPDIIDKLFNEGKEIITEGTLDEFLKLPIETDEKKPEVSESNSETNAKTGLNPVLPEKQHEKGYDEIKQS